MAEINDKYDHIGEFCQGVAIVVKDNLYGAVLTGGYEIIPPTYDYISPFREGYAQAIRKGECRILDLSGRECKRYNDKFIAIPSKYDEVREFNDGYAGKVYPDGAGVLPSSCCDRYRQKRTGWTDRKYIFPYPVESCPCYQWPPSCGVGKERQGRCHYHNHQ